ncbi:MAG: membrane protein insertase YidC [Alphaproteobacteria bacterium]|nr:membrane protein insertase YidC [Alphaproteobacteria bacterium]
MKNETKDLILAIACTLLVFFALDYFFPRGNKATVENTTAVVENVGAEKSSEKMLVVENKAEDPILKIKSDTLSGQIRLRGAVINELTFLKYKQTIEKDSPDVKFLTPSYFAYMGVSGKDIDLPNGDTVWTASSKVLTPTEPVVLSWKNKQGIVFKRTISLDDQYMFTITDAVENNTDSSIFVSFDGSLKRLNPALEGATSVHQGFVGVLDGKLQEEKYSSVETKNSLTFDSNGGWMGLTDKYWLAAFAFNPAVSNLKAGISYSAEGNNKVFDAHFETPVSEVDAGGRYENTVYFFAGPKELDLITDYQKTLGIDRFELAIDFGWYYFLTKPFLYILSWLFSLVGNMGVAILIFATLLRILMLPIAAKSFVSMAKIRKIQPKLAALKERYGNDQMRLNQEALILYKKENVNPAAGCLPMFIQIPVFFSLYKVLSVSIEMRHAPFFGWIRDLSARDPSSVFTLFGLVPWPIPSLLNIGVWPILMGITMYLQQKMNPQANAPSGATDAASETAKMMKLMPLIFTFMMGNFASGLVIYWTWSNVLAIAQQRYVMHKYGVK